MAYYSYDRGEYETTQNHQLCLIWIECIFKTSKTNERWSSNGLHAITPFWQWRNHKGLNVPMDIFCDTKINELVHERFYVYNSLSLYNGCLETVHIDNQIMLHFVNIWSKKVIVNISYPSTVNKIDGYLDSRISPTSVKYIISR